MRNHEGVRDTVENAQIHVRYCSRAFFAMHVNFHFGKEELTDSF